MRVRILREILRRVENSISSERNLKLNVTALGEADLKTKRFEVTIKIVEVN